MDQTLIDLAKGVRAYLQELRDRDVPYELAEQLVRDWHAARLQALYGGPEQLFSTFTPAARAEEVGQALRRIASRDGTTDTSG